MQVRIAPPRVAMRCMIASQEEASEVTGTKQQRKEIDASRWPD
jgi:hypothetical protein